MQALLFCMLSLFASANYYKATFMQLNEAQKNWGTMTFNSKLFKASKKDFKIRSSMAVKFIKTKRFVGKTLAEVRKQLGSPDGYMFSESIIGYRLAERKGHPKEIWQVVFVPNISSATVKEVKVHKKCCYSAPSWLHLEDSE